MSGETSPLLVGSTVRFLLAITAAVTLALSSPLRAEAQDAPADPPARAGRLAVIDHAVSLHRMEDMSWSPAIVNYPVTSGLAFWADQGSRAEIGIGSAALRMGPQTELDVDRLDDRTMQMRLPQGSLNLTIPVLAAGESFDVETPRGHLHVDKPGVYRFDAGTTEEPTRIVVFEGDAAIVAPGSSLDVHAGETGLVTGTDPLSYSVDRAAVPAALDEWARARSRQWHAAPRHVAASATGYEVLDDYGTWQQEPEMGEVWYPRALPADWEPYRDGRWEWVAPWGWTWIDDAPWGFAPFHYGRWAEREGRWGWIPGAADQTPVYAPALVAFVGVASVAGVEVEWPVGWIPLGPHDVYRPSFNASPTYFRRVNITNINQTNIQQIDTRRIDVFERGGARLEAPEQLQNRRFAVFASRNAFGSGRPISPLSPPASSTVAVPAGAPGRVSGSIGAPTGAGLVPLVPGSLPSRQVAQSPAAPGPRIPAAGIAATRFVRPLAAPGRAIPGFAAVAPAPVAIPPGGAPPALAGQPMSRPPAAEPGSALRPIQPDRLRQPGPPAIVAPSGRTSEEITPAPAARSPEGRAPSRRDERPTPAGMALAPSAAAPTASAPATARPEERAPTRRDQPSRPVSAPSAPGIPSRTELSRKGGGSVSSSQPATSFRRQETRPARPPEAPTAPAPLVGPARAQPVVPTTARREAPPVLSRTATPSMPSHSANSTPAFTRSNSPPHPTPAPPSAAHPTPPPAHPPGPPQLPPAPQQHPPSIAGPVDPAHPG